MFFLSLKFYILLIGFDVVDGSEQQSHISSNVGVELSSFGIVGPYLVGERPGRVIVERSPSTLAAGVGTIRKARLSAPLERVQGSEAQRLKH